MTLFSVHAPTDEADENRKKSMFVPSIQRSTHDLKIILGDLNAKMVRDEYLRPTASNQSLDEEAKDSSRFTDFASACNIIVKTTQFQSSLDVK